MAVSDLRTRQRIKRQSGKPTRPGPAGPAIIHYRGIIMELRRKTKRKATFELESQYKLRRVILVIDLGDFWIMREFVDHGRGFSRIRNEQWLGKSLVETLYTLQRGEVS